MQYQTQRYEIAWCLAVLLRCFLVASEHWLLITCANLHVCPLQAHAAAAAWGITIALQPPSDATPGSHSITMDAHQVQHRTAAGNNTTGVHSAQHAAAAAGGGGGSVPPPVGNKPHKPSRSARRKALKRRLIREVYLVGVLQLWGVRSCRWGLRCCSCG